MVILAMQKGANCRRCGRRLTDPVSIRCGLGPTCRAREMEEMCRGEKAMRRHRRQIENEDAMPVECSECGSTEPDGFDLITWLCLDCQQRKQRDNPTPEMAAEARA